MPRLYENPPIASDFMEAARSFGNYNLAFSLADLIDNSITAGSTRIDITDNFHNGEIRITDNGCGMTESELITNMRMGSRNPNTENEENDLGRFGLGLKTASFAQARRLTVISKKDGKFTAGRWDLDSVAEWKMTIFTSEEVSELVSDKFSDENGTEIIWEKLNRLLEDGAIKFDDFNAMMAEAESEISLVFHRYLSGELDHRPKLIIARNNRKLIPFDPFCQANDSTHIKDTEFIELDKKSEKINIKVKPFILPHYTNLTQAEDELLGGKEGYIKNQGFYIYREYRLIIRGTWFKLAPHGQFSNRARIRVDIPNSLDIDWKITVDKSEAELPWQLRLRLKDLLAMWVIPDAIKVFTERKPKALETVKPVWNRHNTAAGVWHFSINKVHPLLSAFINNLATIDKLNRNASLRSQFTDVVRLLENCLPIEEIKKIMDKKPQSANGAYIDAQEIIDTALTLREHMIQNGHSQQYVIDALEKTVPFNTYHSQIKEYFIKNPL